MVNDERRIERCDNATWKNVRNFADRCSWKKCDRLMEWRQKCRKIFQQTHSHTFALSLAPLQASKCQAYRIPSTISIRTKRWMHNLVDGESFETLGTLVRNANFAFNPRFKWQFKMLAKIHFINTQMLYDNLASILSRFAAAAAAICFIMVL